MQPTKQDLSFSPTDDGDSNFTGKYERPKKFVLIDDPRQFAATFAAAVTTDSNDFNTHWIAKNGEASLFKTLQRIFPEIAQPTNGRHRLKGKIACAEFNKLVQAKVGFMCSRTRKQSVSKIAGNWLFSNRRWLDPSLPEDRKQLERNYFALCSKYAAFSQSSLDHFLECIADVCDIVYHRRSIESMDFHERTPSSHSSDDSANSDASDGNNFHSDDGLPTENAAPQHFFAPTCAPAFAPAAAAQPGFDDAMLYAAHNPRDLPCALPAQHSPPLAYFPDPAAATYQAPSAGPSPAFAHPPFPDIDYGLAHPAAHQPFPAGGSYAQPFLTRAHSAAAPPALYPAPFLTRAASAAPAFVCAAPAPYPVGPADPCAPSAHAAAAPAPWFHPAAAATPYQAEPWAMPSSAPAPVTAAAAAVGGMMMAVDEPEGAVAASDPSSSNAGEDMDARLHDHWAANPTLRVEASELERFGRSTSF